MSDNFLYFNTLHLLCHVKHSELNERAANKIGY